MATDDISKHACRCPCGKSTVTFVTASPDHPWARPSQTKYSASIDCGDCKCKFCVYQVSSNDVPVIVERAEVEARRELGEQIENLDKEIRCSIQAERLRARIIDAIDKTESMAGRLRKLHELRLTVESYSTYRKNPYGGEAALRFTRGATFARIGSTTDLGGEDQRYFSEAIDEMQKLEDSKEQIRLKVVDLKRDGGVTEGAVYETGERRGNS